MQLLCNLQIVSGFTFEIYLKSLYTKTQLVE